MDAATTKSETEQHISEQSGAESPVKLNSAYAKYVLVVLTLVYIVSLIDRSVFSILAEDIKLDLQLSDAELGFLAGTAFSLFYALFAVPLARLSDCWNRKKIVTCGLTVWSVLTAMTGFAKGFISLGFCRFGVGAGEASATPAIYSLIYDYFTARVRTTAIAVYTCGGIIGAGAGLYVGGLILEVWSHAYPDPSLAPLGLKGWQAAFLIVGTPGLLLAVWVGTLKEPIRGLGDGLVTKATAKVKPVKMLMQELLPMVPVANLWSFYRQGFGKKVIIGNILLAIGCAAITAIFLRLTGDTLQWYAMGVGAYSAISWLQALYCRDRVCFGMVFFCRTQCYLLAATSISAFMWAGAGFWNIPYFIRTFDVDKAELGLIFGGIVAGTGLIGTIAGGVLADKLRHHTQRGKLYTVLVAWIASLSLHSVLYWTDDLTIAYISVFCATIMGTMASAPLGSTYNDLVIPRTRAVTTSIYFMIGSFIGGALGAYCLGIMSDIYVARGVGEAEALQTALQFGLITIAIAVVLVVLAITTINADEDSTLDRARTLGEDI